MPAVASNVTLRLDVGRPLYYEELDTNFEQLKFTILDTNEHIDSTTAHDASAIVYDPATSDLTATNVQGAIDEHVESTTAHSSQDVTYDNSASYLSATNVKQALDELGILNNASATVDPTVTDDANAGYSVFSKWVNTASSEIFVCLDNTVGSAVWAKSTLTLDDLGTAALVNMGTGSDQIRTNSENDLLYTDEQQAEDIAANNAINFAVALG